MSASADVVPTNASRTNAADDQQRASEPPWLRRTRVIGWWAVSSGIVFSLIGLGVAWAMEERFGLPHASLIGSPLDLLELSAYGMIMLGQRLAELFPRWWIYIPELLSHFALIVGSAVGVLLAVPVLLLLFDLFHRVTLWTWRKLASGLAQLSARGQGLLLQRIARSDRARARGARARAFIERYRHEFFGRYGQRLRNAWRAASMLVLYGALSTALPVAVMLGAPVLILLVFFLPLLGEHAGQQYIERHVLVHQPCQPVYSMAERLQKKPEADQLQAGDAGVVQCVEVQRDGKAERGQVVIGTSTAVLLFNPNTGDAMRIPTEGSVIRAVSSLDGPGEPIAAP